MTPFRGNQGKWLITLLIGLILIASISAVVWLWWNAPASTPGTAAGTTDLQTVLRGDDATAGGYGGYAQVTGPQPFQFPADHAAHPDYRSEWWYFTGNVTTPNGRSFGFQLTFFRFALAPSTSERASDWATRQAWMAHFAITDVRTDKHRAVERFQRGALGLAGASLTPVRIWLDNWFANGQAHSLFPMQLHADSAGMALDLQLISQKPVVLQGDHGYSRKSSEPGNASYYYSYTRLHAEGTLTIAGQTWPVSGTAWLDREWSTSALGPQQVGWDWFALQLDDGRDVMLYRLRRRDGTTSPYSGGVVVGPNGEVSHLSANDFQLTPRQWWRSPKTGIRYPVAWQVHVPSADLDMTVTARVADQEMRLTYQYWEGAVSVEGQDVSGVGYLEMTGYGQTRP